MKNHLDSVLWTSWLVRAGSGLILSPRVPTHSGMTTYEQFQPCSKQRFWWIGAEDHLVPEPIMQSWLMLRRTWCAARVQIASCPWWPSLLQLTERSLLKVFGSPLNRIPKARGKAWFGICESFSQLNDNWTILMETVSHIQNLSNKLKVAWL